MTEKSLAILLATDTRGTPSFPWLGLFDIDVSGDTSKTPGAIWRPFFRGLSIFALFSLLA